MVSSVLAANAGKGKAQGFSLQDELAAFYFCCPASRHLPQEVRWERGNERGNELKMGTGK